MSKLEKALEALNVEISRYVISNDDRYEVVVVGGLEVINKYPIKDFKEVNGSWEKINISGIGKDERVLLPFMYIDRDISFKHLEELRKFRDMKTLSKEESLNYEVIDKDRLLNKIVYLYDKNPSTNSLALAKQFDIEHFHVIQQIFKLAESNPSILMGVKYSVYKDVTNRGGKVKDVEIVGSNRLIEHSINQSNTNNTQTIYRTFLHITEDVYYKFVSNMGTPKSKEMKVYRQLKQDEYFTGFQRLRELAYSNGYKTNDIE